MRLDELIKDIKDTSLRHYLVNEFGDGDVYEYLNSGEHKYPLVFLTITSISDNDTTRDVNCALFYVDRLTSDQSNKKQVQAVAVNTLGDIIYDFETTSANYTPFTEKFTDLCAGAYVECTLNIPFVPGTDCGDNFEIRIRNIFENGTFNVEDYDEVYVDIEQSQKVVQLEAEVEELNATVEKKNQDIRELTDSIEDLNNEVNTLEGEVTRLENTISILEEQLENCSGGDCSELETQIENLQSQIDSLQSQIATKNQQITSLQSQVTNSQSQIDSLNAQITELNEQITTKNNRINTLQNEISILEEQLENCGGTGDCSALETQISNLQTQITELEDEIAGLEAQIATKNAQISNLNGQVSNLNNQVSNLQDENNTLSTQNNTLSTQNTNLQNQVSSLQSDKTALQNQVINLNSEINTLSTQNRNLQSQINSVTNITITDNGTYTPPTGTLGYNNITVNVDYEFDGVKLEWGNTEQYATEGNYVGRLGSEMFANYTEITEIPDIFDFSNFKNLQWIFNGFESLVKLPAINSSNCLQFNSMFSGCARLKDVIIDTSNGQGFDSMFYNCTDLESVSYLYLTGNCDHMFENCGVRRVTGDISPKYMISMFENCYRLLEIQTIDTTNLASITEMHFAFQNCFNLKEVRFTGGFQDASTTRASVDFGMSYNLSYDSVKSILQNCANGVRTGNKSLLFNVTLSDPNGEIQDLIDSVVSKGWTLIGLGIE